ncbi:MAG TPA: hypothetical protein VFI04_01450 [Gaiellaceae bacterium]|nr:hypothetical protein [Gaiellaceae bacterium]
MTVLRLISPYSSPRGYALRLRLMATSPHGALAARLTAARR